MSILTLPDTTEVIAEYPYFPTRQQLFIWRNWGMVKTETLADVLGTDVETVNGLAADMGLDVPMKYNAEYAKRCLFLRDCQIIILYQTFKQDSHNIKPMIYLCYIPALIF